MSFNIQWLDPIGAILSLCTLTLFVQTHRWAWLVGLMATSVKIVLYFDRMMYGQVMLKCIYLFSMAYGWYKWSTKNKDGAFIPIRPLNNMQRLQLVGIDVLAIAFLSTFLATCTNSDIPVWDAAITVVAFTAHYLTCHKVLDNWLFWIGADILIVYVHACKDLPFNSAMHLVYLVLACVGYRKWRKKMIFEQDSYQPSSLAPFSLSKMKKRLQQRLKPNASLS